MAESDELVSINPSGFLNLLLHVFRFWSQQIGGEKHVVYGLLLGTIEGNMRHVTKIVPIAHKKRPDLEMGAEFMKEVGKVNRFELESQSMSEVIGWYRSSNDGIKFIARDIKNHITFQEFNPKFIGLIIDPELYLNPDEGGFSIYRLKGDKYYNMMTDYYKIPWEIRPIEDSREILANFQGYIKNYFKNKPLITELDEY